MSEYEKPYYEKNMPGDENRVLLRGWVDEPIHLDHQTENGAVYATKIRVERISGVVDLIPIFIKESKLVFLNVRPKVGDFMEIEGCFHSKHVYSSDNKRTLKNYVYVGKISFSSSALPCLNEIHLTGEVFRCGKARVTTGGRHLVDFLLKVRRKTHRFSKIPCIIWGEHRSVKMAEAGEGAKLKLVGRIQSREYLKIENGVETFRTVYEVSVTDFEIKES